MNFSKESVIKKQKQLKSRSQRIRRRVFTDVFKVILSLFVLLILVMAGAGFGMMKGILDDSPDVSKISIKPKGFKTVIYDQNGKERDTLSTINSDRIYIYYDDIPEEMINAFVSIEDERYWKHNGIDVRGIFRALVKDVVAGNFEEGASTITQQLIKNQVFNVGMDETTKIQKIERKIQEQYLAIELEKRHTKEELLEYYLNTIYLGQGVNGVEAAAQRYFEKSCSQLKLSEIAVIAGITKNPYKYDPVVFPTDNNWRRTDVLDKMLELGYIDQTQYDTALNDDVYSRIRKIKKQNDENFTYNSFYTDDLMRAFVDDLMDLYDISEEEAFDEMYTGGYSIYSVQDYDIQKIVDEAVNDPEYYPESSSVALEYRLTLLDKDEVTTYNYDKNTLLNYYRKLTDDYTYSNIYPTEEDARAAAETYKEAMMEETGATFLTEEFKTFIQPQATFTVIDHKTGYVKAICGGRGEKTENLGLDRATMSPQQPGSTFKVLAGFLPYIDTEGGLGSGFEDKPFNYEDDTPVYNWYGGYRGPASLRDAIRDSMNIIAVQTITAVTPAVSFEYLLNMGFTTLVDKELINGQVYSDVQQATALGGLTYGVTNLEITAAYASIANMGTYVKPVFYSKVYDHDGNIIIDNTNPSTHSHKVCDATTAYQLIDAMKDVVTSGTGTRACLTSGIKCAGKTGTTSNSYDLWFCGMTPYYTSAVWFGYDSDITINTEMHKAMWRDINDRIAELENQDPEADWAQPEGLTKATVCKLTGLLPSTGCPTSTDWFAEKHVPKKACKGHITKVVVCKESHFLATNTCPKTQEYDVTYDDEGNMKLIGADFKYDKSLFTTKCPLHPEIEGGLKITTSAGKGGTISDTVVVKPGDSVTIYIVPKSGYRIKKVIVDGKNEGAISERKFKKVKESHTVEAYFEKVDGGDDDDDPTTAEKTEEKTEEKTKEKTTEATTEAPTEAPPTEPPTEAPPTEPPTEEPTSENPPPEEPTPEGQ